MGHVLESKAFKQRKQAKINESKTIENWRDCLKQRFKVNKVIREDQVEDAIGHITKRQENKVDYQVIRQTQRISQHLYERTVSPPKYRGGNVAKLVFKKKPIRFDSENKMQTKKEDYLSNN